MGIKLGGNVIIDSVYANKIPTNDRDLLCHALKSLFWSINNLFHNDYSRDLWDNILDNNIYYSGSTKHLFDFDINQYELALYKPYLGDIDIKVNSLDKNDILCFLSDLSYIKQSVAGFILIGYKQSVDQVITLWYNDLYGNIQIDFEFVDFIEYTPTNWAIFSKNSEWCDVKLGIKAVFHKLLFRAITAKDLDELTFLNETGKQLKHEISSYYAFSVTHGLRYKFKKVQIDNKDYLQKLRVKDSRYITNVNKILNILFDKPENYWWSSDYLQLANSYTGLTELIIKNCDRFEHENIFKAFQHSLFSNGAQQIYRDVNEDLHYKNIAIKHLKDKLYIG